MVAATTCCCGSRRILTGPVVYVDGDPALLANWRRLKANPGLF